MSLLAAFTTKRPVTASALFGSKARDAYHSAWQHTPLKWPKTPNALVGASAINWPETLTTNWFEQNVCWKQKQFWLIYLIPGKTQANVYAGFYWFAKQTRIMITLWDCMVFFGQIVFDYIFFNWISFNKQITVTVTLWLKQNIVLVAITNLFIAKGFPGIASQDYSKITLRLP